MKSESSGPLSAAAPLEEALAERRRRRLDELVAEALADYPAQQAARLRARLPQRIELRRYEHGGDFVVVFLNDGWWPLERALSRLAEDLDSAASGEGGAEESAVTADVESAATTGAGPGDSK